MKTKYCMYVLFVTTFFSCTTQKKEVYSYQNITKWKEFTINSTNTGIKGELKLLVDENEKIRSELNYKILTLSSLLKEELGEAIQKNKIADLIHQKETITNELNLEYSPTYSTAIFNSGNILTYKIMKQYELTKEVPYVEYINIDTEKLNRIEILAIIDTEKTKEFQKIISDYTNKEKRKIVNNYLLKMAETADHLQEAYTEVFEKKTYSTANIQCEINSTYFSHFNAEGIVFNVNITDENFLKTAQNRIEKYTSYITIPYELVTPYIHKESNLFASINNLIKIKK